MLADLGIFSIALPAEAGGAGGTVADLAAALEQLTDALVPGPVMPTLLAGPGAAPATRTCPRRRHCSPPWRPARPRWPSP